MPSKGLTAAQARAELAKQLERNTALQSTIRKQMERNANLRSTIRSWERDFAKSNARYQELVETEAGLHRQLDGSTDALDRVTVRLCRQGELIKQLEGDISDLHAALEKKNAQCQNTEQQLALAHRDLEAVNRRSDAQVAELKDLWEVNNQQMDETVNLQATVVDLARRLAGAL